MSHPQALQQGKTDGESCPVNESTMGVTTRQYMKMLAVWLLQMRCLEQNIVPPMDIPYSLAIKDYGSY